MRIARLLRAAAMLLSTMVLGAPDDATELPPLAPLTIDLRADTTVIATPQGEAYRQGASRLADAIEESAGRRPLVVDDSVPVSELGNGPVVALGNLMASDLVRELYFRSFDFTDGAWPSPGGHVVRTVRDPFGTGRHVVVVGGSDIDGVVAAADELARVVVAEGSVLGYLNRVTLGKWASEIASHTEKALDADYWGWNRSGGSGSWDYQIEITKCAVGYLRTGQEAYLPIFKRELLRFFNTDVAAIFDPETVVPPMVHGFVHIMVTAWDLVRDHPTFSPAERTWIDESFLKLLRSREGPKRLGKQGTLVRVRDNHGTRTALDAFFCGRYFKLRHGLADADEWLDIAKQYFAVQMRSSKPVEDSWGHQWASSLYNTVVYALASGHRDYFKTQAFRDAAERALIAHGRLRAPVGYMCACAAATGDTGFLSGWYDVEDMGRGAARGRGFGDERLRTFFTGSTPAQRQDLLGVAVAPLDQLWYDTIDAAGHNPGGLYVVTGPREHGFDKISFRDGWARGAYYLLFDGISGGLHAYQDGNCIVALHEKGTNWLASGRHRNGTGSVREQTGVFVALDGSGPGAIHRYARKLYAGEADQFTAAAGVQEQIGDADWQRHILRHRGKWTLVIDRVAVRRAGEVMAERHWRVIGETAGRGDTLTVTQTAHGKRVHLKLQSAGVPLEGITDTTERMEVVRARGAVDHPVDFAALIYAVDEKEQTPFRLTRASAGWCVTEGDGKLWVGLSTTGDGITVVTREGPVVIRANPGAHESVPAYSEALFHAGVTETRLLPRVPTARPLDLAWRLYEGAAAVTAVALADDGRVATGDGTGAVRIFSPTGDVLGLATLESPILALHFDNGGLLAGEDRGALTRFDRAGKQLWQNVIPYVSMRWPYWSEGRSRVREIDSADIDGDGIAEVLMSNSDRRVYAFAADGRQLWATPVEWGIWTAMSCGSFRGTFGLYGGTSRPSIHGRCIVFGANGKLRAYLTRPDLVSWSVPCQFRDLRLADLAGDGEAEIVTGLGTSCRQLVVYRQDGSLLWDADTAGEATAVAVSQDRTIVYCAGVSGYVYAFEGTTGERKWACYVGERIEQVAPLPGGGAVAVTRSGSVFAVRPDGTLAGRQDLGTKATALLRPGDHRAGDHVLIGTESGRTLRLTPEPAPGR